MLPLKSSPFKVGDRVVFEPTVTVEDLIDEKVDSQYARQLMALKFMVVKLVDSYGNVYIGSEDDIYFCAVDESMLDIYDPGLAGVPVRIIATLIALATLAGVATYIL